MNTRTRALLAAAAAVATLAFAGAALAANSGSVGVSHTPQTLANAQSTTIHIALPQTDDPIAAINVYVGAGYAAKLDQAAGTNIGTVDATAFSHTAGLTLPLNGPVTTDSPGGYTSQSTACARTPASAAVWILNLSVAGQTLKLPLFVTPTAGAEQALGAYKLSVCLTPWDIPESLGGAPQGAQVLDVRFTVNNVFTTPTSGSLVKWETLFTPYNPGKGTANAAGTFEARAFVPLPIILGVKASYAKKTNTWTLSGKATEGGLAVPSLPLRVARGLSATRLVSKGTAKTTASGTFKVTGKLVPKKTTYFQVSGSVLERDYTATGCQTPLTSVAPAGCVKATLSPWSAKSVVVRVKP
jgi:hypothetical protein